MPATEQTFKSLSNLFGVLSNPVRLKILNLLREQEIDVSHLQQELGISQSRVSQQLHELKVHGLVSERREGKHVYYRLKNPEILKVLAGTLHFMAVDAMVDNPLLLACSEFLSLWGA